MRISAIKTLVQRSYCAVKSKFSPCNFARKKPDIKNISQNKYKFIKKIKNLYYTIKENIYLAKYKLKEFAYSGAESDKNTFYKMDKPTKTRFCQKLKPYLKKVFDNQVDPAEIDKRLTRLSVNVREEKFTVKGNITIGRKKVYTMQSGKEIVLESHNYQDPASKTESVVTRIYDKTVKKGRDYVDQNGNFVHGLNGYKSKNAHLQSGKKGLDWIRAGQ